MRRSSWEAPLALRHDRRSRRADPAGSKYGFGDRKSSCRACAKWRNNSGGEPVVGSSMPESRHRIAGSTTNSNPSGSLVLSPSLAPGHRNALRQLGAAARARGAQVLVNAVMTENPSRRRAQSNARPHNPSRRQPASGAGGWRSKGIPIGTSAPRFRAGSLMGARPRSSSDR